MERRMKRICLAIVLAVNLSSAAFAESVSEKTGVNSALGIAPKTEDFIKQAATIDMLEIEAARIAQQKKGRPAEKTFAEQMIADHTKTSTELKDLVPADLKSVSMIPCRLALTKMRSRCSSATQKAEKIRT
jgi:putative membrane protein